MRQVLGACFAAGLTVDEVLEMSWPAIQEYARCVLEHRMQVFQAVLSPVAEALGMKVGGLGTDGSGPQRRGAGDRRDDGVGADGMTHEQRDAQLLKIGLDTGMLRDA